MRRLTTSRMTMILGSSRSVDSIQHRLYYDSYICTICRDGWMQPRVHAAYARACGSEYKYNLIMRARVLNRASTVVAKWMHGRALKSLLIQPNDIVRILKWKALFGTGHLLDKIRLEQLPGSLK